MFRIRAGMPFSEQADGGHDLSRRAIAALKGVVLDESGLHRMQLHVRRPCLRS